MDYVAGYVIFNDITARDIQFSEAQWSRCKSFDGFGSAVSDSLAETDACSLLGRFGQSFQLV